jgi:hypothetical protein
MLTGRMQVYLSLSLLTNSPVIERPDGTWRAIEKGVAVEPSAVGPVSPHSH